MAALLPPGDRSRHEYGGLHSHLAEYLGLGIEVAEEGNVGLLFRLKNGKSYQSETSLVTMRHEDGVMCVIDRSLEMRVMNWEHGRI